jgi:TolB-like protein/predicted Ser/Thr protein kinase
MIGKTVSHYRITEKLGEGGMGEVYLADDTALGRKVALKFLPAYLEHDETARKRFIREARSAAAIDHPYICKIYEVGEVEDKHFIAMEYVEGEELKEKMARGRLPLKETLRIASQIAGALAEAHEKGIVHRDLKPANVMLTASGHVKVMDFGLAKRAGKQDEDITAALTMEGSTLGTLTFMSPEQVRGEAVDTRSDIFSFGVVLYEMLTGVHPFRTGTQAETVNAILNEHPSPLSRYTEDTSDILQHTVEKMLAKDPDERYQLIREVRTNLKKLTEKLTVSGLAPASVKAKRSPLLVVVVVVALLVVAVIIYSVDQPADVEEAPIDSIAVLPFDAEGTGEEIASLAEGIPSSISNDLLQLGRLKVKPTSVLLRYAGKDVDPNTVSNEQDVVAVLKGRVDLRGDALVVNANLLDGRNNTLIWGDRYARQLGDVFAIEEDIARQVAGALLQKLSGREANSLTQSGTQNPQAYQAYRAGIYHRNMNPWSGEDAGEKAVAALTKATELDPNYQDPLFELGRRCLIGARNHTQDQADYQRSREYWERLVEIDPTSPLGHLTKAELLWRFDNEWNEANLEYRKAEELAPSKKPDVEFLAWTGRYEEAVAVLERQIEQSDPFHLAEQSVFGFQLLVLRQYDKVVELAKKGLALDPDNEELTQILASAYSQKGMEREAFELNLELHRKFRGTTEEQIAAWQKAYDESGIEGVERLRGVEKPTPHGWRQPIQRALHFTKIGDEAQAFEWLRNAWEVPLWGIERAPTNHGLDPLRDDPRFEELLRKLKLPEEAIQKHLSLPGT